MPTPSTPPHPADLSHLLGPAQDTHADLAIVGGGVAGTFALIHVVEALAAHPAPARPWRIAMVDRTGDFFAGAAYGHRAGRASLTISALDAFLAEPELRDFVRWLERHRDEILGGVGVGEGIDRAWLTRREPDIRAGRWRHMFVPRRLFGRYLRERSLSLLARHGDVADVRLLAASVEGVAPVTGGVTAELSSEGRTFAVTADRMLLAVGSPPVRALPRGGPAPSGAFVDDIHSPSLDDVVAGVRTSVLASPGGRGKVLVVGGNAEAIEVVHAVHSAFPQEWARARVTVLAPAGRPRHWRHASGPRAVRLPALDALSGAADLVSRDIREAVESDLDAATAAGRDRHAVPAIMDRIIPLVDRLDEEETRAFVTTDGMAISNLLRQAGGDAVDALEGREAAGGVRFVAGRYREATWQAGRGWRVAVGGPDRVLEDEYAVIINATGFESVSGSREPLLRSLLASGLARASGADRGLAVAPDFTCADRIHVVGPLLAGNTEPRVWHLESARRIIAIAKPIAAVVAERMLEERLPEAVSASD